MWHWRLDLYAEIQLCHFAWNKLYIKIEALFKIVIFHKITFFFYIFDQINAVLLSIRDLISNFFQKYLSDPKLYSVVSIYIYNYN